MVTFVNMLKIEKKQPFYLPLKILTFLKMLPNKDEKYLSIFLHLLLISIAVVVSSGIDYHLFSLIRGNIKEIDFSEDVFVLAAGCNVGMSYILFFTIREELMELITDVLDFRKFGKPCSISQNTKRFRLISQIGLYGCIFFCICNCVVVLKDIPKCLEIKEKLELHGLICGTFLPTWLPFSVPKYVAIIIFIFQFTMSCIFITSVAMLAVLSCELFRLLGYHIDHLNGIFKNIVLPHNYTNRRKNLKLWIQYHNHIINMTDRMVKIGKRLALHAIYISAMVLGFGMHYTEKSFNTKGFAGIFGWLMALFLVCFTLQGVMDKTNSIQDAIYDSLWYTTDVKTMKDVLFILKRSQKLYNFKVFPNGDISLELFVKIIQASYSYMTLLSNPKWN